MWILRCGGMGRSTEGERSPISQQPSLGEEVHDRIGDGPGEASKQQKLKEIGDENGALQFLCLSVACGNEQYGTNRQSERRRPAKMIEVNIDRWTRSA